MLSVVILNVVMLNVIMLSVVMLGVIMLSVVMLNVVIPYVVAPSKLQPNLGYSHFLIIYHSDKIQLTILVITLVRVYFTLLLFSAEQWWDHNS
jgi:hypothetical protein